MNRSAVTEEKTERIEMEWRETTEQTGRRETYPIFFFFHATPQNESDYAFEFSPFFTLAGTKHRPRAAVRSLCWQ